MQHGTHILPMNIGLTNHSFKLALDLFLEKLQKFQSLPPLVHQGNLSDVPVAQNISIVLFVERALSLGTASSMRSEVLLNNALLQLDIERISPVVTTVDVVDCGVQENGPLSAIIVLQRWLEMIADCLSGDVEVNVHAIDIVEHANGLCTGSIFNTASDEFRVHLTRFIDSEIAALNGRLESRGQGAAIKPNSIGLDEALFSLEKHTYSGFEKFR